jgi:uncharacterized membrane protein
MSWKLQQEWFALGVVAVVIILAIAFGPSLPEWVPSHYDLQGNVDQHMQRTSFLLMVVGLSVGLYLLMTFLPFIDPFRKRIAPRYGVLMLLRDIVLGFMLALFLLTFLSTRGGAVPLNMLGVALGVLFALIGNYLPKTPRNWFFGIRTPWTMASDTVWLRSHLVGGWMFVVTGLCTVVLSLLGVGLQYVLLPGLAVTVMISGFVYPLFLHRRLQKGSSEAIAGHTSSGQDNSSSEDL